MHWTLAVDLCLLVFAMDTLCRILVRSMLCSMSLTKSPMPLLGGQLPLQTLSATLQSIIELSRTQDEEVGDGTTSVIILGECT